MCFNRERGRDVEFWSDVNNFEVIENFLMIELNLYIWEIDWKIGVD